MDFRRFALLLCLPLLLGTGPFKLYDDDSRTSFSMVEPMDCTILKSTANGITLGFKFGVLFVGVGPEITFGEREQVKWEQEIQALMVQYKELCARFNTGAVTKRGYEARLRELDAAFRKARQELVRGPEDRSNRLFDLLKEEERTPQR